jgi:hypothetical protein
MRFKMRDLKEIMKKEKCVDETKFIFHIFLHQECIVFKRERGYILDLV